MNDDATFQYALPAAVPELTEPANIALAFGSLSSRLVAEMRTRVVHPDGRSENVAEHSLMLAKVSLQLARTMYPELDEGRIVTYAIIHDDVEAYVGDTPTDTITPLGREQKAEREAVGVTQLVREFADIARTYTQDIQTYEEQREPEARFVRVVDKLMTLLIHIPNEGAELRKHWTFEKLTWWTIQTANDLQAAYPEFDELVSVRTELAMYIARKYLSRWEQPYGNATV